MLEQFRKRLFNEQKLALLDKIMEVIAEYDAQKIKMTLRQLFYQLVSRDIIPNTVKEYKKLGDLLTDARYAGLVDWDAIEDRIRVPQMHPEWDDVKDLIES